MAAWNEKKPANFKRDDGATELVCTHIELLGVNFCFYKNTFSNLLRYFLVYATIIYITLSL